MNILEKNKMLNEQYYGKNPILLDMEKQFESIMKICNDAQTNSVLSKITPLGPEANKQIQPYREKIEKDIEDLFNFKTATVSIINFGCINAFTLNTDVTIPSIVWAAKEQGEYGVRFVNKERSITAVVSVEILTANNMTPALAVAALLHEIGHNFYYENNLLYASAQIITVLNVFKFIESCMNISDKDTKLKTLLMNIPILVAATQTGSTIINNTIKLVNKNKELSAIMNTIINIMVSAKMTYDITYGFIMNVKNIVYNIKNMFNNNIFYHLLDPLSLPGKIVDKRDEMFADNFATMYGYGYEISLINSEIFTKSYGTALLDKVAEAKAVGVMMDFLLNVTDIIPDIFASHGSVTARIVDQINYLEKNLKNDSLTEDQKKSIQHDLSDIRKSLDELDKYSKMDGEMVKNGRVLAAAIIQNDISLNGGLAYKVNFNRTDAKGNWKNLV